MKLTKNNLYKFIEFCSEARGYGDFSIYLGLSQDEVIQLKKELEINSADDAKALIRDVIEPEKKLLATKMEEEREFAKQKQQEAQERMDELASKRLSEANKRKKRVASALKLKKDDKRRQKRFEKQEIKTAVTTSWRIPNDTTPEKFSYELRNYGFRFICSKYNIDRNDIMSEVSRLKLKINFDLVPR